MTTGYYDGSYTREILGLPPLVPDPHIDSLTPSSGSAAAGAIAVQVDGSNFEAGSVVEIDQVLNASTYVSATRLTTSFDPTAAGVVLFTVRNPNDEESNSVPFTVAALVADDVSAMTVTGAEQFVAEHPELLSEVYAFELAGKARATLLAWLKALLDEEAAQE